MSKELPWQYWLKPTKSNNTVAVGKQKEPKIATSDIITREVEGEFNLYEGAMVVIPASGTSTTAERTTMLEVNDTGVYPVYPWYIGGIYGVNNYVPSTVSNGYWICVFVNDLYLGKCWRILNCNNLATENTPGCVHLTNDFEEHASDSNYAVSARAVENAYNDLKALIDALDDRISTLGG